jgi:hypothetical protein
VGDWPARPGVRRRLTLRGVLDAAGDGVAAEDEFAVALRRVGIGAWRGSNQWLILLRRGRFVVELAGAERGRRVGRKGRGPRARARNGLNA